MSYGMNGWNKPSGDLISRAAVIREIMTDVRTDKTACLFHVNLICNRLERLPAETQHKMPCDLCVYNPPSSADGKPCALCPAEGRTYER